jgi:hypothetical protein
LLSWALTPWPHGHYARKAPLPFPGESKASTEAQNASHSPAAFHLEPIVIKSQLRRQWFKTQKSHHRCWPRHFLPSAEGGKRMDVARVHRTASSPVGISEESSPLSSSSHWCSVPDKTSLARVLSGGAPLCFPQKGTEQPMYTGSWPAGPGLPNLRRTGLGHSSQDWAPG